MDRDELALLLAPDNGACDMARAALEAGAEYRFHGPGVLAQGLAADYWARQQTTAEQGIRTTGLAEAIHALRAMADARVSIAAIGGQSYGWLFIAFVDDASGTLVACTGVEQQPRPESRLPDQHSES